MKRNLLCFLACGVMVAIASSANAAIVIWDDPDPAGPDTQQNVNIVVTPIADPTGDAGRVTVGEVNLGAAGQWSSLGLVTPAAVTPAMIGAEFTLTFDYYVPTATTLTASTGNLFGQIATDEDGNAANGGFTGLFTGSRDTWESFSWTDTLPDLPNAPDPEVLPTTLNPLIVFNQGATPVADGTAFYVDNIRFEIVPEPTTLGLMGAGATALAMLRRRRRW